MSKMWGVHMPAEESRDAVDDGFVAIGWSELGDIFNFDATREAYKEALPKVKPYMKAGAIPVEAGALYRFVHEIKKGDYVLFPSKHDRMVNIGKFTGETFRREGDYPNCRKVQWLGHFPRSDFSQSALYEIGSFITLFAVRKHKDDFIAKATGKAEPVTDVDAPDDDAVTTTVSRQAEETTRDFIIRKIHTELDGYEFEYFVAHILECMGYHTRVSEKSGDGGVDVIAHTDELGFQPPIIKVQCKRKTGQAGEPEASQLLGTLGEGEYALFVNLGSYSRPARVLERNRSKLRLIDGDQFVELILENYEKMSARYRTLLPLKSIYVPDLLE